MRGPSPARSARLAGAALGLAADRLLGEPPARVHPVAAFGSAMARFERLAYRNGRAAGMAYAGAGLALGTGTAPRVVIKDHPFLGEAVATAAAGYMATAGRSLAETATSIGRLLEQGRLEEAGQALPALVGRDPTGMDEKEMARAVVESVAENTVDAVVAPAFWSAVTGTAGAFGYRAVNTMDSMVGHKSPRYLRYGWASARLDDGANFIPARLTVALVAAARPGSAREVWRVVRRDGPKHPSPNAGPAEAAFAAALGLRLGGTNHYGDRTEVRGPLGHGRAPEPADIARAVRLSRDVAGLLGALLVIGAGLGIGADRNRTGGRRADGRRQRPTRSRTGARRAGAEGRR